MSAAGLLGFAVLALLLTAVGSGLARLLGLPRRGAAHGAVFAVLAGLLAWHLLLQISTLLGIPWSRPALAAALLLLLWLSRRLARQSAAEGPRPCPPPLAPGWGDGAAAFAILSLGLLAPSLWITLPDFVYHWGLKGEHAFLTRGIDYAWLAEPWNWSLHPDYPHLLPILYGSTSILAGRFDASALQLWSVLFLAATVLAVRAALAQPGLSRGAVQGGVAWVGLATAAYSIGYLLAGGADGIMALALAAALPALLSPLEPGAEAEIGLAAGFAAAGKIEGVPLAGALLGVHLLRRLPGLLRQPEERRGFPPAVLKLLGPTLALALPWYLAAHRYHLFQATNSGPFDFRRGAAILSAAVEAANAPELHGLPWLTALLPLAWLTRRTRPLAAVATAQLAVYLWVYFASVLEVRFYVLSNFARLLFQLLPAVLVGVVVAFAPGEGRRGCPPEAGKTEGEGCREASTEQTARPVEQV
ncbi:MAG TPA: hypothetical protein VMM92_09055 [Thermoanaerobaculia bacterium]|nr:hypothetical protein [Thermoanaerobaculia bacterium]